MARSGNTPDRSIQIGDGALDAAVSRQGEGTELAFRGADLSGFGKPVALQHHSFSLTSPDDEHVHGPTETAHDSSVEPCDLPKLASERLELLVGGEGGIVIHAGQCVPGLFGRVLTMPAPVPILSASMRGMTEPRTPIIIP